MRLKRLPESENFHPRVSLFVIAIEFEEFSQNKVIPQKRTAFWQKEQGTEALKY